MAIRSEASAGDEFAGDYTDRLREHVVTPDEQGLEAAYGLGRRALAEEIALLDLVAIHQDAVVQVDGAAAAADAFLREALGAFEIARGGWWEAQQQARLASERVELLHGLNDAYLAVLAASTLDERVAEVTRRVVRLVDAERAEVVLESPDQITVPDGALAVDLPGDVGQIHVWPRRGREFGAQQAVSELALLVGGPLRDARLMQLSGRLAELGAVLATATEPDVVVGAFLEHGLLVAGAPRGGVLLRESDTLKDAGIPAGRWASADGDALAGSPVMRAVAEGAPAVFASEDATFRDEGVCAFVPLNGSSERIGAIGLGFDQPQAFDIVQRNFLVNVADRVGVALERSVLFARERLARIEAQTAADRFRSLQEFAGELARTTTRRNIADLLLRRLQLSQRASVGFVAAYDADRRHVEVLARVGAAVLPDRWPAGVPLIDGIVESEPLTVHGTASIAKVLPSSFVELPGVETITIHPIGQRELSGVVVLGWLASTFSLSPTAGSAEAARADVALAGAALRRAGQFDVEHDIAQTLQRNLLTIPSTNVAGLRWAVRYQAGSAGLAGGDWYDVIECDERSALLVIGDVVGKGVEAAASVGQLRSASHALARRTEDPLQLMLAMDEFALAVDDGVYSSLGVLKIDVVSGRLEQVLAGHLPPVLVRPTGEVELLYRGQSGLVGMSTPRQLEHIDMPAGSLLVLYTDGLVERRGESLDVGLRRLTDLLAGATAPFDPRATCDGLIDTLASDATAADDTAVLAVVRDVPGDGES